METRHTDRYLEIGMVFGKTKQESSYIYQNKHTNSLTWIQEATPYKETSGNYL